MSVCCRVGNEKLVLDVDSPVQEDSFRWPYEKLPFPFYYEILILQRLNARRMAAIVHCIYLGQIRSTNYNIQLLKQNELTTRNVAA